MLTPDFPYCGNKTLTLSLTLLETLQGSGRPDYVGIIILMFFFLHRTYLHSTTIDFYIENDIAEY